MTRMHRAQEKPERPHPTDATTLDRLGVGQTGRVLAISSDHSEPGRRLVERLGALGLVPGTAIRPLRRAPLGDPVVYRVCDFDLCLRAAQAALVTVSITAAIPTRPVDR
ncbi:FeoA family protein [Cryobacterium sp. W22_MBD10_FK3]|uniref:FeoA family protein n=1 Tax=Cryobacterium sp. W22_MBD10_FK3 TaxID=3240273 RepID=UPI003F92F94A